MKKILCVFLAVILLNGAIAPISPVLAAETKLSQPTDLLTALGVEVKIETSEAVTRSEFLYILMQVLKYSPNDAAEIPFSDISSFEYYYPAVKYALDIGIISSSDKFYPYSPIRFQDACKMMVSALGMDFVAKNNGGYPTGFLAAAQQCDLTDGIEHADQLTKDTAMALFANFLQTKAYSVIAIEGTSPYYEVLDDSRTILSLYHNIEKVSGIITANRYTGLYDGNSFTSDDEVEIDEYVYKTTFDSKDFMGKNVDAFVKDGKTVVYMQESDNKVVTVKSQDIIGISANRLLYADNTKEIGITLSATPAVIYNGRADKGFKLSSLAAVSGQIDLFDNNGDRKYDVICVSSYRVLVVDSVDILSECIFGKDNSIFRFDDEAFYTFVKNGADATAADIISGDLLQIYESKDNGVVNIKIAAGTNLTGTITESNASARKFYIDGVEYEYNQYFIDNHLASVSIGDSITALLTDDGILAAIESGDSKSDMWGYIIAAKESSGLDAAVTVKMFSNSGAVETRTVADKVMCDGNPKTSSEFYDYFSSNSALFGGLIRYTLNGDGKLNLVDTANNIGTVSNALPQDNKNTEFKLPTTIGSTAWFIKSSKMIAGCLSFANAKIFVISPDESLDDDQRYALTDASYFVGNTSYPIAQVRAFNVDDGGAAEAIMIAAAVSNEIDAETSPYAIVSSVTRGINADGNEGIVLRMYYRDAYTKYY
ncbi:MAG: hypothetical protein IKV73_07550, partial [Clostridia bacterium]|nr:hypothetical protein [Clostridia bacterium]